MVKIFEWYLATWWTVMMRPIYFFTLLEKENWRERPLSFLLISSWVLALLATVVIFITQYLPMGATLVEGIVGVKFLIILPVIMTLAFFFLLITFLILGGLMAVGFTASFYLLALALHYIYKLLGGGGSLERMVQSCFYCSGIVLAGFFPLMLVLLVRQGALDFSLFRVGVNLTVFLALLFLYGLLAVAGKKNYGVSKTIAFAGALLPIIFLLIISFVFDKIALGKLEKWMIPLK